MRQANKIDHVSLTKNGNGVNIYSSTLDEIGL